MATKKERQGAALRRTIAEAQARHRRNVAREIRREEAQAAAEVISGAEHLLREH